MTVPRAYAKRYFREDHNILGVALGRRKAGGEATGESALVFFVERKLPIAQCGKLIPAKTRLRSDSWKEVASSAGLAPHELEDLKTDVVETGPLQLYGLNLADRVRHFYKANSVCLAAKLEIRLPGGSAENFVLASAHGVSYRNSLAPLASCHLIDPDTGEMSEGTVLSRFFLPPRGTGTTAVDAALIRVQPGVSVLGRSKGGTTLLGHLNRAGGSSLGTPTPGESYSAIAPSGYQQEHHGIDCSHVGAVIRGVPIPGTSKTAIYDNQVITSPRLRPGDSGAILHANGRAVAMLNGGTAEFALGSGAYSSPVNFCSPIKSVLEALLLCGDPTRLSFVV